MRVFVSWSGGQSGSVATLLREWLPNVLHSCDPWISTKDIRSGLNWFEEIGSRLDEADFGISCLTKSNIHSPWLMFEAGALAKKFADRNRVAPLLVDLRPADLPSASPWLHFQAEALNQDGVRRLVMSIDEASSRPIGEARVERAVDMWWPELGEALEGLPTEDQDDETSKETSSSDRVATAIDELLERVRTMQRGSHGAGMLQTTAQEAKTMAQRLASHHGVKLQMNVATGFPGEGGLTPQIAGGRPSLSVAVLHPRGDADAASRFLDDIHDWCHLRGVVARFQIYEDPASDRESGQDSHPGQHPSDGESAAL